MQGIQVFDRCDHWVIEAVVDEDDEAPAVVFLERTLRAGDRDGLAAERLVATIRRFGNLHRGERLSRTRFAPLTDEGGLFEFKEDQLRLFCCFATGGRLVLLNGLIGKKHTAQRARERAAVRKAAALKREVDKWYR